MKTVREISRITGVSVRTLHHYDAIGLLRPAKISEARYRLYGDAELQRLYRILIYRELGLPLNEIRRILDAPDADPDRVLRQRMAQMQKQVAQLQDRIQLANVMQMIGVNNMDFEHLDIKKIDDYEVQAKALYGKTDAYKEYTVKSKNRSRQQSADLGRQLMDHFAELGKLRAESPESEAAQQWVVGLVTFLDTHYYTCNPQILSGLAESYAGGGSMTENIDKAGGPGTGAFAKAAITAYLKGL